MKMGKKDSCHAQPQPHLQLSWAKIALLSMKWFNTHPGLTVLRSYRGAANLVVVLVLVQNKWQYNSVFAYSGGVALLVPAACHAYLHVQCTRMFLLSVTLSGCQNGSCVQILLSISKHHKKSLDVKTNT